MTSFSSNPLPICEDDPTALSNAKATALPAHHLDAAELLQAPERSLFVDQSKNSRKGIVQAWGMSNLKLPFLLLRLEFQRN